MSTDIPAAGTTVKLTYTVDSPGHQVHGRTKTVTLTVDRHIDGGFVSTADPRVPGRDDLSWKVDLVHGRAWTPTHVRTKGRDASPIRVLGASDVSLTIVD